MKNCVTFKNRLKPKEEQKAIKNLIFFLSSEINCKMSQWCRINSSGKYKEHKMKNMKTGFCVVTLLLLCVWLLVWCDIVCFHHEATARGNQVFKIMLNDSVLFHIHNNNMA